ncbi:MAG: hypothetical protein ACTSWR_10215 [Candidatus Helarchaeota archaeon]
MKFRDWFRYITFGALGINGVALIVYLISLIGVPLISQTSAIIFLCTIGVNAVLIFMNFKFEALTIIDVHKWVKLINWSFTLIIVLSSILIAGSQLLYLLADAPPYNLSFSLIYGLNILGYILVYAFGLLSSIYNSTVMNKLEIWIDY